MVWPVGLEFAWAGGLRMSQGLGFSAADSTLWKSSSGGLHQSMLPCILNAKP